MESTEDDAGAATNASRRASAREKDVGGCEEGSASDGGRPAAVEAGATSETASMSEEAFDGDSVPSPSTQDVNTSTEAILDMIDEIVDGPGAPKRLTLASDDIQDTECANISEQPKHEPTESDADAGTSQSSIPTPAASAESVNVCQEDANNSQPECSAHSDAPTVDVITDNIEPLQASSTVTENVSAESTQPEVTEPTIDSSSVTVDDVKSTTPEPPAEHVPTSSSVICDEAAESLPTEQLAEPIPANLVTEDVTTASTESEQPDEVPASSSVMVDVVESLVQSEQPTQACSSASVDEAAASTREPCEEPVPASSSETSDEAPISTQLVPHVEPAPASVETEATSDCPVRNIPSSSVVETIQSESDTSESQMCERTIKCVTSSDNRDNVTVESAESTSSDSSVSERRMYVAEGSTRSPLRRRLVRPAPSDRRPDSTVSSTVDSQTVNVHTTEQTASECVTKDVSSSSDAVPAVYGNVKPEEIRNVSEISVCIAETSMSPPKKIKLIRQKVTIPAVHKDIATEMPIVTDRDQCQSTSSGSHLSETVPVLPETNSANNSTTSKSEDVISELNMKVVVEEDPAQLPEPVKESEEIKLESEESLPVSNCLPGEALESETKKDDQKKVPPMKLNLSVSHSAEPSTSEIKSDPENTSSSEIQQETIQDPSKQVPKLTIKFGSKQPEEMKSPIPKLTIKPIRPPNDEEEKRSPSAPIPSVTKINIKPILKPPEKINDIHRKSSSSEISESECSENDESNSASDQASTSDQTSASDQGSDVVPKVTIKLGKPGTESEGKFYTEKNTLKLAKGLMHHREKEEQESGSKLKLVISHSEEKQSEKVPKLTIKTVTKSDGQPLSPKLTIKPLKPPENISRETTNEADSQQIPKLKIATDSSCSDTDVKETTHVPKITIKPVVKTDCETSVKTPKKSAVVCDSPDHIPVVTKLNIKPILKPTETSENAHELEEKLPVVSKLNIKPILKPMDGGSTEVEDNVPVISKLNIKPILKPVDSDKIPEELEEKVHMVSKLIIKPILKPAATGATSDGFEDNIPVVSKLNIKPVLKPTVSVETSHDLDKLPVVSKLNIKPILKPAYTEETPEGIDDKVPVVSKLNIKPIVKPKDNEVGSSIEDVPKITKLNIKPLKNPELSSEGKDCDVLNADIEENSIPVVTKLNIKPVVKPIDEDTLKDSENQSSETGNSSDDNADHIPVVTKLNIKPIVRPNDSENSTRSNTSNEQNIPVVTKLNIKPLVKPDDSKSPGSPKKDNSKYADAKSPSIPVVTKLNIKPVIKPDEPELQKLKNEEEISAKNPPLLMKINMKAVADISSNENLHGIDNKVNNVDDNIEHYNNVGENIPIVSKINIKPIIKPTAVECKERISVETSKHVLNCKPSSSQSHLKDMLKPNSVLDSNETKHENYSTVSKEKISSNEEIVTGTPVNIPSKHSPKSNDFSPRKTIDSKSESVQSTEINVTSRSMKHVNTNAKAMNLSVESSVTRAADKKSTLQNCTLLKKLLETKKDGLDKRLEDHVASVNHSPPTKTDSNAVCNEIVNYETELVNSEICHDTNINKGTSQAKINDFGTSASKKLSSVLDLSTESNESLTKPLEINVSEKVMNQSSGQDSPRIILKINKTDHGASAKIITEEIKKPESPSQNDTSENTHDITNDKQNQKKNVVNSRKKPVADITPSMPMAKRLRSSRVAENVEKSPIVKRNVGKRPSATDSSPPQGKDPELSVLETKRLKLGQLLSTKSLTTTPVVTKAAQLSPTKSNSEIKPIGKSHSILNNENCSKNGNSKLHNILSNLQAKQAQAIAFNDLNCLEKKPLTPELECSTSTGSSDVVEIIPVENSHPEVQEMIINESSESHDFNMPSDDMSQDPLEVDTSKEISDSVTESPIIAKPVEMTPQPKKRGRPRKLPVSEGAKPVALPVPALEERPQRSLRLYRCVLLSQLYSICYFKSMT